MGARGPGSRQRSLPRVAQGRGLGQLGINGGLRRVLPAHYAPVYLLLSTGCLADPLASGLDGATQQYLVDHLWRQHSQPLGLCPQWFGGLGVHHASPSAAHLPGTRGSA